MKDKTVFLILGALILVILFWPIKKSYANVQIAPANKPNTYYKAYGHESWACDTGYTQDPDRSLLCKKNGT